MIMSEDIFIVNVSKKTDANIKSYTFEFNLNNERCEEIITVTWIEKVGNVVHVPNSFWEKIKMNGVLASRLNRIIHDMEKGIEFDLPIHLGNLNDGHER